MDATDKHPRLKVWLRWIALLPGALVGGLAAQAVVRLGNARMLGESFIRRLLFETIAGLALGIVSVLAGVWIAPFHKHQVAFGLVCLALLLSGAAFLASWHMNEWGWPAWSGICVIAGAIGASYRTLFPEHGPSHTTL